MKLFVPFEVLSKADSDNCVVEGYASTEALDSQNEIVKREALERALPDYMKFANIREMHQPSAVGVAVSAEHDDKGLRLRAHIVDPIARKKVEAGVYKGFSIGGRVTNRDKANKAIITGLHLTEISLVDRPANPEAMFDVWKAESGEPTTKGMMAVQMLANVVEQVRSLAQQSKIEEAKEGDTVSVVPGELQAALTTLTDILNDMVEEETAEINDGTALPSTDMIFMAEGTADVAKTDETPVDALVPETTTADQDIEKRGARHSAADQSKLNAAHDAIVAAGAQCDAMKHESPSDLTKANSELVTELAKAQTQLATVEGTLTGLTSERDQANGALADLTKALSTVTEQRDELQKKHDELATAKAAADQELALLKSELDAIKAQPEPMKGKVIAIAKGDDVTLAAPPAAQKQPSAVDLPKDMPNKWFSTRPTGEPITANR